MSADTISAVGGGPSAPDPAITDSDNGAGGAGRGGGENGAGSPLVVVQGGRGAAPPRPAARTTRDEQDNTLRNGYAAISHGVSGETAAIGVGFLLGGPVGAVIGGAVGPVTAAVIMWRARRREDDENSNGNGAGNLNGGRDAAGNGRGNGGGRGRNDGAGGGRHKTPKTPNDRNKNGRGGTDGTGKGDKRKPKDPVGDKLGKLGKGLADKLKNKDKTDKAPKNGKGKDDAAAGGGKHKAPKDGGGAKGLKDGLKDGVKGLRLKDRGKQPASDKPWAGRGDKPDKPKKEKKDKAKKGSDDASSTSARDGLDPKNPKNPKGPKGGPGSPELDQVYDGEIVDGGPGPRKYDTDDEDIVDAVIVEDEDLEKRIQAIRDKAEKARRRRALKTAKKAAQKAAREQDAGDPKAVRIEVRRQADARIDLELAREDHLLALVKGAETPRSRPVNYPVAQTSAPGTRQAGVAVSRQIEFRGTAAYAILRALAEQLASGYHNDDDADMADHIVELVGIPNMCKNLSTAVVAAGQALSRTAPLHATVIKHLNNAATAARTAGIMAENIMIVFVQAHREDIIRVLDPRIGEERWNIRNARGTLDAAKLKAAIASAHSARLALPAGASANSGGGKLEPISSANTKKLVDLMKGFTRGHMVTVLSEVNGSAVGVDAVADSIGKLYRRMTKTWPTENVVDDTVAKTAGQVRKVSTELKKAVAAAKKMHARELRLNAKGRAGKGARVEKKWDVVGRRAGNN